MLDLAQEEARLLNHNYVGTEHVLLGPIGEGEGVAAQALESLGMTRPACQQVEDAVGRGQQAVPRHIPVTPRAKKVLELPCAKRCSSGSTTSAPSTCRSASSVKAEGVAGQALVGQGADLGPDRQQVILAALALRSRGRLGGRPGGPGQARGAARHGGGGLVLDRVESIDTQLTAIGQRLGAGPELRCSTTSAQARRGKEAAAGQEDYEAAAALRDRERRLLADRTARQQAWVVQISRSGRPDRRAAPG